MEPKAAEQEAAARKPPVARLAAQIGSGEQGDARTNPQCPR